MWNQDGGLSYICNEITFIFFCITNPNLYGKNRLIAGNEKKNDKWKKFNLMYVLPEFRFRWPSQGRFFSCFLLGKYKYNFTS